MTEDFIKNYIDTAIRKGTLAPSYIIEGADKEAIFELAKNTAADAVVCYTHTGDSARRLSGMGCACPIFAICDDKRTFRQLGLAWNVHPIYVEAQESKDITVDLGIKKLKEKGYLAKGDKIVLSGGKSYISDVSESKIIGGFIEV